MTEQAVAGRTMGPLQLWIACRADGLPILETAAWTEGRCAEFAVSLRGEELIVRPFTLSPDGQA